jgi:microcystin-dependent protein
MDPYLGEIRPFAGSFAPSGWHFCDGSLQSIANQSALYTLLGTTYGGDGQTTFGLPDLRGRVAVSQGNGPGLTPRTLGQMSGEENVTLTTQTMPAHIHLAFATSAAANSPQPSGNLPATPANGGSFYLPPGVGTQVDEPLATDTIAITGSGLPHNNIMPSTAISYIIAMNGIYPSQN